MNKDNDGLFFGLLMLFLFIGILIGGGIGSTWGRDGARMEAIKAGAAEYITNKETGTAEFQWIRK